MDVNHAAILRTVEALRNENELLRSQLDMTRKAVRVMAEEGKVLRRIVKAKGIKGRPRSDAGARKYSALTQAWLDLGPAMDAVNDNIIASASVNTPPATTGENGGSH